MTITKREEGKKATQANVHFGFFFCRVHVRRTDKNTEAAFYSIEEYMYWVDLYYNKLERVQTIEQRRVYLATDESNLLSEAKNKYVSLVFILKNLTA